MHSSPRPWHQWGLMWAIFLSSWWMFQFASPAPPWSHRHETVKPLPMLPIKPLCAASNLDSAIQEDWATDAVHWAFLDSLALDSTPRNLLSGSTAAWFGLHRFFLQLPKAQRQRIEIYHWGDSQIEGDRITGELRRSLQSRWGGHGPGWVMPIMPAPQGHVRSSAEGNILRRTGFGRRRDTSAAKLPSWPPNRISEYTRVDRAVHRERRECILLERARGLAASRTRAKAESPTKDLQGHTDVPPRILARGILGVNEGRPGAQPAHARGFWHLARWDSS